MSRKTENQFNSSKVKRPSGQKLEHALDTLTTAHHVLDEQEAEEVEKALEALQEAGPSE